MSTPSSVGAANESFTPRVARRAFTLIELTMALLVTSILVGAVGSLVVMTARAAGGNPKAQSTSGGTADSLSRFSAELACALTISNASPTTIIFTIPDRNNDGATETVAYSWGGSGSPLRRSYNGAASEDVTGPLSTFNLGFTTISSTTTTTNTSIANSGEVLLSSFSGWTGITPTSRELGVTASAWGSEFFKCDAVSFPQTLTQLSITRVRLMMRAGTAGNVLVGIQSTGTSGSPSGTQVGTAATTPYSALGATQAWISVPLSGVSFSSVPSTGLNIVIKGTATTSGYLRYLDSTKAPADTPQFVYSTTSGGTWLPAASRSQYDVPFEVYGTYQYSVSTQNTVTVYNMRAVNVTAQSSTSTIPMTTTVRTLNNPSATGPSVDNGGPVPTS